MWLMRLLAVLTVIAAAGGMVAYALTRNPKYLQFSMRLLRYAVVVGLLFFGLLILERVAAIPL